jgi:hypothetical protein
VTTSGYRPEDLGLSVLTVHCQVASMGKQDNLSARFDHMEAARNRLIDDLVKHPIPLD